jgi:hypothetical protein
VDTGGDSDAGGRLQQGASFGSTPTFLFLFSCSTKALSFNSTVSGTGKSFLATPHSNLMDGLLLTSRTGAYPFA